MPTYSGMVLHVHALGIVSSEVSRSFAAEFIWILFYTTFASCQIGLFISTGTDQPSVSFSLGFGQILPLVLLGLPVLSTFELYLGRCYFETGLTVTD